MGHTDDEDRKPDIKADLKTEKVAVSVRTPEGKGTYSTSGFQERNVTFVMDVDSDKNYDQANL